MILKNFLAAPQLYHAFQLSGGFFQARIKAIARHLKIRRGQHVVDIGCGPGHIVEHLPAGVKYSGFDISDAYITYARRRFGARGEFYCRYFDDEMAKAVGPADVVMMNGVLHHINDAEVRATLHSISHVLKPDGILFTLDGVPVPLAQARAGAVD